MELHDYWKIAKKWWWLAVACVLISSVSSYLGTLEMPRIYRATTTVIVGQTLSQADPNSQDIWISQQLAQTYAEMVKRQPILKGAAEALGLQFVPSSDSISTRQVPSTQLLEISVRDTDPERARALADEIATQLILQSPTASQDQERQAFIGERLTRIEQNISGTEAEMAEEQEKLEAANSARAIQQYQANINALQQKLFSYEATYAQLLLSAQGGTNYISLIEPATTPVTPISPNVPETVALAGAIGLALAVGGAVLIEYLDDTVKSVEEAVKLSSGLPMLGAIADIVGKEYSDKLVAARSPLSPITEAYRVLRTNVQFSAVDDPLTTIMVTSPGPSEGKSITVANLAVVLAQSGKKVILVDADLRRPVQHRIFQVPNQEGFCDAILERGPEVMRFVQQTAVDGLCLLTSGQHAPNAAELLSSDRARQLINTLGAQADVVLFDSPPLLVVADASILSSRVDGVILVNALGNTRRTMARRAVDELRRAHGRLLGLVVNRMSQKYAGDYYYQYSYYHYLRDGEHAQRRRRRRGPLRWVSGFFGSNGHSSDGRSPVDAKRADQIAADVSRTDVGD
jgi:non-specific protein-tyrosine kinase